MCVLKKWKAGLEFKKRMGTDGMLYYQNMRLVLQYWAVSKEHLNALNAFFPLVLYCTFHVRLHNWKRF